MSDEGPPTTSTGRRASNNNKNKKRHEPLRGALAGSEGSLKESLLGLASGVVFGAVSPLVGHPFDTVKTRMQAESRFQHTSVVETVRTIYRSEGVIRGFYRGFVPPLLGSMAFRGIQFSAYSGAFATCQEVPILATPIPYTGGLRPSVVLGGLFASLARAVIESPFDFVKVRYMVGKKAMKDVTTSSSSSLSLTASSNLNSTAAQPPSRLSNWKAVARSFAASPISSIRHLYHGFSAHLFRTTGLLGSVFIMVDYSARYIPDIVNAPLIGPFFQGGVCATAGWVFAFPFESAKSIIQADTTGKYKNGRLVLWKVMWQLYQERGIVHGLYRGFAPGASRSFVANGASMVAYAWIQNSIRQHT